jgi:hypothetical protein
VKETDPNHQFRHQHGLYQHRQHHHQHHQHHQYQNYPHHHLHRHLHLHLVDDDEHRLHSPTMSSLLHAHLPPLVPAALVTAAELGPAWLQRCMTRDFGERHIPRRLAVALSGGADSTALAHMAALWAREEPKTRSLVAFHVNHNVRANSGAEQAASARS